MSSFILTIGINEWYNWAAKGGWVYVKTDEILRAVRSQTMLSQARFAKKFCVPIRTYEQWERGLRVPPVYVVKLIVRLLEYEGYLDSKDYI